MDIILNSEHTSYKKEIKNLLANIKLKLKTKQNFIEAIKLINSCVDKIPHIQSKKTFIHTILLIEEIANLNLDTAVHYSIHIAINDLLDKYFDNQNIITEFKKINTFIGFSYQLDLCGQMNETASLKTENNKYILNGSLKNIIYPDIADYFLIFAKENEQISAFIVKKEKIANISIQNIENSIVPKIGEIEISNLELGEENLIWNYNDGKSVLDYLFNELILLTSACFIGIATDNYESSVNLSKEIKMVDRNYFNSEGLLWNMGESAAELSGIKLIVLKAGYLRSNNRDYYREALSSRIMSSSVANNIIRRTNLTKGNQCLNIDVKKTLINICKLEDFFVPVNQAKLMLFNDIFPDKNM